MDPESKLFYREFLDFGPGVGYREGKEKFMREKREQEAQEALRMDNIAMTPDPNNFLKLFMQDRFA